MKLPDASTETRILRCIVVDDQPMLADVIALSLEVPGQREFHAFKSGDTALRAIQESDQPLDLLITDFDMPGMNGIDLARRVRDLSPRTRIVMVTGSTDVPAAFSGCPDVDCVVPKPFSFDRLENSVSDLLPL